MTNMLERVARAICSSDGNKCPSECDGCPDMVLAASVAITAMRDCTPAMLDAGSTAHPAGGYKRETLLNDIIECEWRAMVDAALKL